jgi:excisionase family DNA binding protein
MTTASSKRSRTYLPPSELNREELTSFIRQMEQFANKQTVLRSASGEEVLVPDPLFDVLRRVATSLASGRGVTVMSRETLLTTQEAGDFLGVSRPTLIKLVEGGQIPFEVVGRHRRVMLRDLEEYQENSRTERRALLRRSAREDQAAGMHDLSPRDMPKRE